MNERLCEVLSKCYEISTNSVADVFFEYAPHCESFSVYVYRNGWSPNAHIEWLALANKVSEENLNIIMTELEILECELGVA